MEIELHILDWRRSRVNVTKFGLEQNKSERERARARKRESEGDRNRERERGRRRDSIR